MNAPVSNSIVQLNNIEAERNVISACIFDENHCSVFFEQLTKEMFTDYECKRAYDVMLQMVNEGKKIESTEVAMRLINCGGNITLFTLNTVYVFELTRQRVELLRELQMKRQMYALGAKCMSLATDATSTADDFSELMQTMNGSVAIRMSVSTGSSVRVTMMPPTVRIGARTPRRWTRPSMLLML